MADAGETSVRVFFIIGVLVLLAVIGLGLWYFFAPRAELDRAAGDFPDRTEVSDIETPEVRDSLSRQLVLTRYDLERVPAAVSGSVVNNTGRPFVNVQVGFHLYDAQGNRIGTVRDTMPIIEADDFWNFQIGLRPEMNVARVEHFELQGTPKVPIGPDPRTVRRPEEEAGGPAPAGEQQE